MNITIADYLESAIGSIEASDQIKDIQTNPWRLLASFLYAGKIYE